MFSKLYVAAHIYIAVQPSKALLGDCVTSWYFSDHSVSFSGTLCSWRMYAAVQRSKAPQGADPASSGVAGGGSRWRGGLCVRPILPCTFPTSTTALCWSRGASRYFRNHAGSCRGQREGAAQLRRGHQASTTSTREDPSSQERRRQTNWVGWGGCGWEEGVGWAGGQWARWVEASQFHRPTCLSS